MRKHYNKTEEEMQAFNEPADHSEHTTISMYEFSFRTHEPYRSWILEFINAKQYSDSTDLFKQYSWETFKLLESEGLLKQQ